MAKLFCKKENWDDDDYLAEQYQKGVTDMTESEFKKIQRQFGYEYGDDEK